VLYGLHDGQGIDRVPPGGGSATTIGATVPEFAPGVDVFPDGKIYIPCGGNKTVRVLDPANDSITPWVELDVPCYSVLFLAPEAPPWPIPGDATGDCKVNILDLIYVRNRLNQDPGTGDNYMADVNEDGKINILDLIYVRNRLNTKCPE